MENIEVIISLVITCIGLLSTAIAFGIKVYKYIKEKVSAEGLSAVLDIAQDLSKIAESTEGLSGEEKLTYVLENAEKFASENDLDFDAEKVESYIESLISYSHSVNA